MRPTLLVDWLTWLGLPVLVTALSVGAIITPQDWPAIKVAILAVTVWTFWLVGLLALWMRWRARPTYELTGGTQVWTNGIDVPRAAMETAVRAVIDRLPLLVDHRVEGPALESMFAIARVEFVRGPILLGDHEVAGWQRGPYMRVRWLGGLHENAFFHEVIHMVHDVVLRSNPDYRHSLHIWWSACAELHKSLDQ
jgi:hypothetical protein